jgi:hypothetical protein
MSNHKPLDGRLYVPYARYRAVEALPASALYISGGLCARKKATVDFNICNRVSPRDSQ